MAVQLSRRNMVAGLALSPMVAGMTSAAKAAAPFATPTLAQRRARLLGTAVRPDQLAPGTSLEKAIRRDTDILVPEYHGQWSAVEWIRGKPYHGNYDAITAYARVTGKKVRGHSLIWEQMTPEWARKEIAGQRDWSVVDRHFSNLLVRHRGRIDEWIVVNEMIDTESGDAGLRRNSFQQAFGHNYVAHALETAHRLDPDARLMINDYGLVHDNPTDKARRAEMLRLVGGLKARGVPLHIVGLQGHIELAKGPIAQGAVRSFLTELAAMGVEVAITELDVLESDRSGTIASRDAEVADATARLLDAACDSPALTSVTTWGLSDRSSWLQDREPPTRDAQRCSPVDCHALNRGLPYDGAMQPKPIYKILRRYIT